MSLGNPSPFRFPVTTLILRILIADDHQIVRHGLKLMLLEEYPFAYIEEAENGKILFEKAKNGIWDIIITDLTMPEMSGMDALRKIKEHALKISVLILSMHTEERYAIEAYKAGASGYLAKSVAQHELINAIRKILAGKKYFSVTLMYNTQHDHASSDVLPHLLLSERELTVLKLLASGKSITKISEILSLDPSTVSTYRSRVLEKMKMSSNADMTRYALEHQLL